MLRIVFLLLSCLLAAHAAGLDGQGKLKICDDDNGWPPYLFQEPGKQSGQLTGYAADVLERIAHAQHLQYQIDLLPWERCLQSVRRGDYQMALNGSYSEQRDHDFLLTRPYYSTHSAYFYSRRQHPGGIAIATLSDLKHYRVCGLHGYNYRTYGLGPGDVDDGAIHFPQLLAKLRANHCDLFIEKREVMAGFALTDPQMHELMSGDWLGFAPLSDVPATGFHMMVSRAIPNGEALRQLLNQALDALDKQGDLARLEKHYLP